MSADIGKYHSISTPDNDNNFQIRDEVDFVKSTIPIQNGGINKMTFKDSSNNLLTKKFIPGTLYGDCEVKTSIKSSLSTLEKLAIFNINKKRTEQQLSPSSSATSTAATTTTNSVPDRNNIKEKHRFVKSASIARLLGNTYNTKKFENDIKNSTQNNSSSNSKRSANNNGGPVNMNTRRFANAERFHKCSNFEDSNANDTSSCCLQDFREDDKDFSAKAFRTISRSLGKLWWKRTHSVEISTPDPEYKVSYLGNVLTGWAKGEGCIEKPLNTLWRNYTQNHKPDVIMRIRVCASGLKATTRQHGLTEYWSHRVTYCCAPKNYPRVFCWIYRHEGRKLKHELRCHAVLCNKESVAQDICNTLRENLDRALRDFKKEKISKQNARLSLANAIYENPSLPRRKILLSVGGNNYRPPLERSKSAPKLMAIEEAIGEEDGETEQEMPSCCAKESLYPAVTLGRRRCRRGHSIRRTGRGYTPRSVIASSNNNNNCNNASSNSNNNTYTQTVSCDHSNESREDKTKESIKELCQTMSKLCGNDGEELSNPTKTKSMSSLGSDEDDLEKLLSYHDYDTNSPLAGELLSYFDMKMNPKTTSLENLNDRNDNYIYESTITSDPKSRPALSMDHLDSYSCEESVDEDEDDDVEGVEDVFYCPASILELLQKSSAIEINDCNENENNSNNFFENRKNPPTMMGLTSKPLQQQHLDSDEGSISSGCETASTVTANMDDTSLKYNNLLNNNQQITISNSCNLNENDNKFISKDNNSNISSDKTNNSMATKSDHNTHQRQITQTEINFKNTNENIHKTKKRINFILPNSELNENTGKNLLTQIQCQKIKNNDGDVSDSEFSDESGYVEFQEHNILQKRKKSISL